MLWPSQASNRRVYPTPEEPISGEEMDVSVVLCLGLACYQVPRKLHKWSWWGSSPWKSLWPQISQDTRSDRDAGVKEFSYTSLEDLAEKLFGWLIGPSLWPRPDLPSASEFLEKPAGRHAGSDLMVVLAMWVVSITGSSWILSEGLAFALWETNYYLTHNLE